MKVAFQSDEFIAGMLTYLYTVSYGYTFFVPTYRVFDTNGTESNHSVSAVMMRVEDRIHLILIDNNNNTTYPFGRETITDLGERLKRLFEQRSKRLFPTTHRTVAWSVHISDEHQINVGERERNKFSLQGYCMLVAYFVLDCVYRNLMIEDSLSTLPFRRADFIVPYFTRILQHVNTTFEIDRAPRKMYVFVSNYSYRLLGVLYYENEDSSLEEKFFDIVGLPHISTVFPGTFKIGLINYILVNKYLSRCMGFEYNGTRPQDIFGAPQRDNSVEYYIAELLNKVQRPYVEFKSVTRPLKIRVSSNHNSFTVYDYKAKNGDRNFPVDSVNVAFFKLRNIVAFHSRSLPKNELNYALPAMIPPPPQPPALPPHLMPVQRDPNANRNLPPRLEMDPRAPETKKLKTAHRT